MGKLKMLKKNRLKESGQIVLIVLLASALVLTVGVSISKRTVTETRIDSDEELLKQAFNTAESGVEYYLAIGETSYDAGNGRADVTVLTIGAGDTLVSDGVVLTGKASLFWLVDHNVDDSVGSNRFNGTIVINSDDDFNGALKIDVFSYDSGLYSVQRYGYNMNGSDIVNGFTDVSNNETDDITVDRDGMLLVVTPINGNSNISIRGDSNFPIQGEAIVSIGKMEGGVNTKIKVENRYEVPVFMLESISSGGSVLSQ